MATNTTNLITLAQLRSSLTAVKAYYNDKMLGITIPVGTGDTGRSVYIGSDANHTVAALINTLQDAISAGLEYKIVATIEDAKKEPRPNTIYMVPADTTEPNIYDEYLCHKDTAGAAKLEKIGTTKTSFVDFLMGINKLGVGRADISTDTDKMAHNLTIYGSDILVTSSRTDTIADAIKALEDDVKMTVTLATTAKTVHEAINELDLEVGNLSSLATDIAATNLVDAANNVNTKVGDIKTLTTTKKDNVVNAVNELDKEIGDMTVIDSDIQAAAGTDTTVVSATNSLNAKVGTLANLTTDAQGNTVAAINELDSLLGKVEDIAAQTVDKKSNATDAIIALDNTIGDKSTIDASLHTADASGTDITTIVSAINKLKDNLGGTAFVGMTVATTAITGDTDHKIDTVSYQRADGTDYTGTLVFGEAARNSVATSDEVDAMLKTIGIVE